MKTSTCTAPVNIAVVKYWGKRDEGLILPVNDSISVTLSSDQMHAKTTVSASATFEQDRIWLNGKEESMDNVRIKNCLREVRKRAAAVNQQNQNILEWKVHICSENNFPTAAGLASSAAGYACLVSALSQLYGVKGDISQLARQGSGSACRSVYGGFVQWEMGSNPDGSDSIAKQLFPSHHWPNMRVLILVANSNQKKVPSSVGMRLSVQTSDLLKHRAEHLVPITTKKMFQAIADKNFDEFAELTMRDSNQLHAVCLDTYPPCTYMNQTSHAVAELVHKLNEVKGRAVACYTFDAGPNACLFLMENDVPLVRDLIDHFFPPTLKENFFRGEPIDKIKPLTNTQEVIADCKGSLNVMPDALMHVIYTKVGNGPEILGEEYHLLGPDGFPKSN